MVATCLSKDRHHALALRMLGNDGQCLHVCVAHHSHRSGRAALALTHN